MKSEFDDLSGQQTTGHEWNGIKELNTPIPRAFNIWLWGSIAVAVALWVLYPSFPFVTDYAKGVLGYSSRLTVTDQVEDGRAQRASAFAPFGTMELSDLAQDATLRTRYEPSIAVLFRDNCAACHGRDGAGQRNFPNLTDDHWLWSGTPDEIAYTLRHGINSADSETRYAEMPAFGRDEWLEKAEIREVIDYVLQISGQDHDGDAAASGAVVFEDNCASCHGDGGTGGYENGAPRLTDSTWIYGGDQAALRETLQNGRAGVMPAWSGRLSDSEIKQLALYVGWLAQDAEH